MSMDVILKGIVFSVVVWYSFVSASYSSFTGKHAVREDQEFNLYVYSLGPKLQLSKNFLPSPSSTGLDNSDKKGIGLTPTPSEKSPYSPFFSRSYAAYANSSQLHPTKIDRAPTSEIPTTELPFNANDTWKWENDIDYDAISERVLNRLSGKDPDCEPYYVVYSVDSTVGFANQFRSFSGVFLLALVSGRRLRIIWNEYFSVMNSPFASLQYSRAEVTGRRFKSYTRFPRGVCSDSRYSSRNVTKIFGNRDLFFNILTDLSCLVLPNPRYRAVLRDLGFILPDQEEEDTVNYEKDRLLRSQIARLLFTPNAEITHMVRKNLQQFTRPHVLSVQLRTGGSVSITLETHRFLYISSLSLVHEEIEFVLQKMHWNKSQTILFVSTDSGIIASNMVHRYKDQMLVLQGVGYRNGHSSSYLAAGPKHEQFLKRAILDLTLMAQSDYVLYTHGSSYGKLAMRLARTPARALCRDKHCTPLE